MPVHPIKFLKDFRSHIIILIIFLVMALISFLIMHNYFISNSYALYTEVAKSYAIEEEKNFISYERFIVRTASVLEQILDDRYKITHAHNTFESLAATSKDDDNINPYGVINGTFIFSRDWNISNINYKTRRWYQDAAAAKGKIILTPVYNDIITKKPLATMAMMNRNGDVVAIDIYPDNYVHGNLHANLPDHSNYFLFDEQGNLFFTKNSFGLSNEEDRENASFLYNAIKNNKHPGKAIYYTDPNGQKRLIFTATTKDDWMTVITVPYSVVVKEVLLLVYATLLIVTIFIIISVFAIIKDYYARKRYSLYSKTVTFLGNIYYSIYLVDFKKDRFIPIKVAPNTASRVAECKSYTSLIRFASLYMDNKVAEAFIDSFSIENIKKLFASRVNEFGGEFKRKIEGLEYWASASLFFNYHSKTNNAILCFKNVTNERKSNIKQYEFLTATLQNMKNEEKEKQEFFASMSHDMRTPLNGIVGFVELGLNPNNDLTKTRSYLEKIKRSTKQLLELINRILDLSRLSQGHMSLICSRVNLKEVLESCVHPFNAMGTTQKRIFSSKIELQDYFVFAPAFELTQVINNLLSNSFKYSHQGDKISLSVKQLNRKHVSDFEFIVEDTGIGMSEEFLAKIFEPYQREMLFETKDIVGTGLGMPIVKNIVTCLNGTIDVQSKQKVGTKVTVVIPFEVLTEEDQKSAKHGDIQSSQEYDFTGIKILVAEDNEINMEIIEDLLKLRGIQVTKAVDGLEAVKLFHDAPVNDFDFILMDMQMPNLNGIEATKKIRTLDREDAQTTPIIALSANAFIEDQERCMEAGMNDYVTKPIDVKKLFETLYRHINKVEE